MAKKEEDSRELNVDLSIEIKRLDIKTKRLVTSWMFGGYKSRFKGRGLEFEDFREYMSSDDASLIDWKASIRADKLLIREFVEERNLDIFFMIDVSNSMIFASGEKLKCEYVAELVAALTYTALHVGDRTGLFLFSEDIVKRVSPSVGRKQFYSIIKTLVNPNFYGGEYNLGKSLKDVTGSMKRNSMIFLISDFIGIKGDWERRLKIAAKKFDLIGIMIRDIRDDFMPDDYSGQFVLGDPYSFETRVIDPLEIKEEYERLAKAQGEAIRNKFLNLDSSFVKLYTNQPFIEPILTFFSTRTKRWR